MPKVHYPTVVTHDGSGTPGRRRENAVGREREATLCREKGGKNEPGKLLVESDMLVFAFAAGSQKGQTRQKRLVIPRGLVRAIVYEGTTFTLHTDEGITSFDVGTDAKAFVAKFESPPSLVEKLGASPGKRACCIGKVDEAFVDELAARGVLAAKTSLDLVFLFAEDEAFARRELPLARGKLTPSGAVWIVYPKGKKPFGENQVLMTGREAGLVDVKVARFSETHTALKFVIPKADREGLIPKASKKAPRPKERKPK